MSNTLTVFKPKGAISFLLSHIKEYNPTAQKLGILPHLKSFIADPTIQELLNDSQNPAASANNSTHAKDNDIQSTLSSLSKAITSIQKQLTTPPKSKANTLAKENNVNSKKTPKTYTAIVSA
jgi:hypothetical protein